MEIHLIHATPLVVASQAIRQCWQSQDKSDSEDGECGPNDRALIDRIGNQFKHSSTLEHISYNFEIEGISRALLQELARHRIASYSVKSTRYTLKELKDEQPFNLDDLERASKFIVLTGNSLVDSASVQALDNLRLLLVAGVSNDKAKYALPEAYKTSLAWTINARSLQNFLSLRTSKAALWEIRDLALAVFKVLPEDHKYLFEGQVAQAMKEIS